MDKFESFLEEAIKVGYDRFNNSQSKEEELIYNSALQTFKFIYEEYKECKQR